MKSTISLRSCGAVCRSTNPATQTPVNQRGIGELNFIYSLFLPTFSLGWILCDGEFACLPLTSVVCLFWISTVLFVSVLYCKV